MRTLRVLLGLLVIMGMARAQAQGAQAPGSTMPQQPAEPSPGPAAAIAQAQVAQAPGSPMPQEPAEPSPGTMPAPEATYPGERATVEGPGGESVSVVSLGNIIPLAARRLVLGRGQATAQVFVKLNFSKDQIGEPTTITPDLYYGLTDFVQVGIVHTTPLGWQTPGMTPTALCVTGEDSGCPKVYNNLGLDALALILPGPLEIAGHLRFNFQPLDPFRVNMLVGLVSKLRLPWFAIVLYPSIQIGLNERDSAGGPTPDGNKEIIYLPGEIVLQVTPQLAILGQAAIYSTAENFEDHYRIPLGVAALLTISPMLDVGARWAWDNVGEPRQGMNRGDERSLVALANFHL